MSSPEDFERAAMKPYRITTGGVSRWLKSRKRRKIEKPDSTREAAITPRDLVSHGVVVWLERRELRKSAQLDRRVRYLTETGRPLDPSSTV